MGEVPLYPNFTGQIPVASGLYLQVSSQWVPGPETTADLPPRYLTEAHDQAQGRSRAESFTG